MIDRIAAGNLTGVPQAVLDASHRVYGRAYNLAWASIIPFVVIAIVAVACLRGVSDLMTEHIEATVEHIPGDSGSPAIEPNAEKTTHSV